MEKKYKGMLRKYADRHKRGEVWPSWYQAIDINDPVENQRPSRYPAEQPHPSTNQHDPEWRKGLQALGPMGLVIESNIWNGLVIDQELRIWHSKEEPIDIVRMPIQSLKAMLQAAAASINSGQAGDRSNGRNLC